MKVVLKADVKGTGKKDQMVEVSDGYARNFLLPRGLAVAANAPDCRVVLADCSEEALRVARTNARLNHLQSRIAVLQADALAPPGA